MQKSFAILAAALAVTTVGTSTSRTDAGPPTTKPAIEKEVRVLDITSLAGKRLDLIDAVSVGDQLSSGTFLLVFFHFDCRRCREMVPKYQDRARLGERIAFIEIPPLATDVEKLVREDPEWVSGYLDPAVEWFVPMLTRIEITDGVVIATWSDVPTTQPN